MAGGGRTARRQWSLAVLCWWLAALPAAAAQQGGGYLTYQEPPAAGPSVLSTAAYIVTVLLTIGLVVALAYFTSRLLGEKFARRSANGPVRLLASLPLGANRGIYVVDIAGKVLVVGAADHSVTLLQEVTDPAVGDALRAESPAGPADFPALLQRQLTAMRQASQRLAFPPRRDGGTDGTEETNRQEKR